MGSQLVEEWASSKLVNFGTGEVIFAHHLYCCCSSHYCILKFGLTRKTLTNWKESSNDHQRGDEAAAQGA